MKAIVPEDTWNDLRYSLYPNGVVKQTAGLVLYGYGIEGYTTTHATLTGTAGVHTGGYDPMFHHMVVTSAAYGYPDAETLAWLGERSMAV